MVSTYTMVAVGIAVDRTLILAGVFLPRWSKSTSNKQERERARRIGRIGVLLVVLVGIEA